MSKEQQPKPRPMGQTSGSHNTQPSGGHHVFDGGSALPVSSRPIGFVLQRAGALKASAAGRGLAR